MKNLNKLIKAMYPDVDFLNSVILQDDGDGPYIKQWNRSEPMPTVEELEAAAETYAKDLTNQDINQKRALAYPNLADQLDMLWHMVDSGQDFKESDFYLSLKKVKDDNPKQV